MELSEIHDDTTPLIHNEEREDYSDRDQWSSHDQQESSFITPDTSYQTPVSKTTTVMSREITRQKLANLYRHLDVEGDVGVNIDRFRTRRNEKLGFTILEFDKTGQGDWVNLTNKRTGEFLKVSSLKNAFGGSIAMQSMLGLEITPPQVEKSLSQVRSVLDRTPTELEMQEMSNEQLIDKIPEIQQLTRDIETNTDFDDDQNMRDIKGLNKALQTLRGELKIGVAKLDYVDKQIEHQKGKIKAIAGKEYDNPGGEKLREREQSRLDELRAERRLRIDIMEVHRKALSTEFSRLRETAKQLGEDELSPLEKLKLVLREHGLLALFSLTTIGLLIDVIYNAIVGGSGGGAGSGGKAPKDENKLVSWVKGKLQSLARLLGRLGKKALAALPGIIGSIISAVFNILKSAVAFAADHIYTTLLAIGTFITFAIYNYLTK